MNKRAAGILLPIFSLPANYGIGTLGKGAFAFVDFLKDAKQSYWQVLPVGHTSYGDSPYQSFSSIAGNPYFVDLDLLIDDGLLGKSDVENVVVEDINHIDYGYIYKTRWSILYKAYQNGFSKYLDEFNKYLNDNYSWLDDYALFMAVKKHFNMKCWLNWDDEDIKLRRNDAVNRYRDLLHDDYLFYAFIQFLFDKQYQELKKYANDKGIKIIGDLPIYVALDSCEVWADSKQFQLNENSKVPKEIAGVPPDYFSEDGQLWGNPLYDWDYMKSTGYNWWIRRIDGISKYFDAIRIDHFRGLEEYWAIPYGEESAKKGHWLKGPSIDFVNVIKNWFYNIEFIAEDLGLIDEPVKKLVLDSGFPGMRVLEFGMDLDGSSFHSLHNHIENSVCYIGTHDNDPVMGWLSNASKEDIRYATSYYGLNSVEGFNYGFIRSGMSSVSKLFIVQMQDYLGIAEAINKPGTLGNWTFRINKTCLSKTLSKKIADITFAYGRCESNIVKDEVLFGK